MSIEMKHIDQPCKAATSIGRRLKLAYLLTALLLLFAFGADFTPFKGARSLGVMPLPELKEASGLAASSTCEGCLWTHNDSGDAARFFLIDNAAALRAEYFLEGIQAVDWEDMGRFQLQGESYLIIGDIGDNKAMRESVQFHIVPEPLCRPRDFFRDTLRSQQIVSKPARYLDGPRDAEALFVDSKEQRLYVISKRELSAGIYASEPGFMQLDTLELKKVGTLPFTFVTAADLSAGGDELLIKNLLKVYYWKRGEHESIAGTLARAGLELPYQPEAQGEAIAFDFQGQGYYTAGESPFGIPADLRFYERRK